MKYHEQLHIAPLIHLNHHQLHIKILKHALKKGSIDPLENPNNYPQSVNIYNIKRGHMRFIILIGGGS